MRLYRGMGLLLRVTVAVLCCMGSICRAATQPNVILIMADDLGYECIEAYGGESYATPRLGRMAQEGVLFEHAHSQPICTPSRVQIMTGKYNVRNYTKFATLDQSQDTFGHAFRNAGYATCVVGKWQLGGTAQTISDFGFDEHSLWNIMGAQAERYVSPIILTNGKSQEYPGQYGPDIQQDYAKDFILRHKTKPFFLYYPATLPHYPFQPTPDSADWDPKRDPYFNDTKYFGDMVALEVDSNVEGEPYINQKGAQYQVTRDSPAPAPGFAEQLVGIGKSEEKEFKIQFPEDYSRGELAGKEASFKVVVTEVKQENLPELTDEFAQEINPDFKTAGELRERVSADLTTRAEEMAKRNFEERVIEAVTDISEMEFPPILAEVEVDRSLNRNLQFMRQSGLGMEQYLKSMNKTEEELREEMRPTARKRVCQLLVLGKIAEEEKVEVSGAEIDAEIEEMTSSAAENKDELKKALNTPQARESIEQTLVTRKTVQRLVEIAQGSKKTDTIQKEEEKK